MMTESKYTLNGRLIGPYQKEGVQWMFGMEHQESGPKGGFLCDEMGLGKTVQLLATILANPQPRTLIIVPKSIITQWHEEIGKFAPELSVNIYDGPERKVNEMTDITIAPYTVLTVKGGGVDALTPLHRMKWDRVILDEAHEIRNRRSKLFKSVNRLNTEIKWIVTGTPVFNSMEDFVSLCTFLGLPKNYVQGKTKHSPSNQG
jgi:SNF2 family DNA or RNA helicase